MKEYSIQEVLEMEFGTKVKTYIASAENITTFKVKKTDSGYAELIDIDGDRLSDMCYTGEIMNLKFTLVEDEEETVKKEAEKTTTEEYPLTMADIYRYPNDTNFEWTDGEKYYSRRYDTSVQLYDESGNNIFSNHSWMEFNSLRFKVDKEVGERVFSIEQIIEDYGDIDKPISLKEKDGDYIPLSEVIRGLVDIEDEEFILRAFKENKYNIIFGYDSKSILGINEVLMLEEGTEVICKENNTTYTVKETTEHDKHINSLFDKQTYHYIEDDYSLAEILKMHFTVK